MLVPWSCTGTNEIAGARQLTAHAARALPRQARSPPPRLHTARGCRIRYLPTKRIRHASRGRASCIDATRIARGSMVECATDLLVRTLERPLTMLAVLRAPCAQGAAAPREGAVLSEAPGGVALRCAGASSAGTLRPPHACARSWLLRCRPATTAASTTQGASRGCRIFSLTPAGSIFIDRGGDTTQVYDFSFN